MQTVTAEYLMGISEGRMRFEQYGLSIAADELDNLDRTIKGFGAGTPVGQMLRGERDFWRNQVRRNA
ncbi:hypothetical protein [Burkholderia cenocepacia]|uniref:hypothetical protein n=1 Tax=Burkholderia cenocepacia TaxID=95486 RepID=UPI0006AC9A77|nr:hypothetical protein [Burkholderia cenocepacia]KOR22957.1 hypothetical protein ABW54_03955 [Burkholderia cenocepacia]